MTSLKQLIDREDEIIHEINLVVLEITYAANRLEDLKKNPSSTERDILISSVEREIERLSEKRSSHLSDLRDCRMELRYYLDYLENILK